MDLVLVEQLTARRDAGILSHLTQRLKAVEAFEKEARSVGVDAGDERSAVVGNVRYSQIRRF